MKKLWVIVFVLVVVASTWARSRTIIVVIPLPQKQLPPAWTHTIHVSLEVGETSVTDHQYFKAGKGEFRATLKGKISDGTGRVEVLCLSKNEKFISVFRQEVKIKSETRSLKLDRLRLVETIRQ